MKLLVLKVLTQFDGKTPLKIQLEGKATDLSLREYFLTVLGSNQSEDGKESIQVSKLGMDIYKAETELEIKPEDVILLKKIVGKAKNFTDLVKGQVLTILG